MKHYQKPNDVAVYAFELDGSQDHLITPDMVPCEKPLPPPPPEPVFADQKKELLDKFRVDRELFLGRIAGIGMAALVSGDTALAGKVVEVRQALLDLTSAPDVVAATNIEDLELAMETAYDAAVQLGGIHLYLAFKKVDK